jgi:hypothetical protein
MSFLCGMKLLLVSLLLILLSLSSCKSEYEERLEQARELRARLSLVESTNLMNEKSDLSSEVELLHQEIQFLAKVSGNEKLFLEEVYND